MKITSYGVGLSSVYTVRQPRISHLNYSSSSAMRIRENIPNDLLHNILIRMDTHCSLVGRLSPLKALTNGGDAMISHKLLLQERVVAQGTLYGDLSRSDEKYLSYY
ncbi:hypothetical protein WA026_015310 [Henosepilachna vigintioctopunctata]|uniref:Uncharacterized protein n=1 Tax=Henosepilachna vigintioctopunctata TaxID=420089 RepID=A0AAW1TP37_9CUCU